MTKHNVSLLIVFLLSGWSTENGYAQNQQAPVTQSDAAISRDTVKKAQKQLQDKGYYQGSINGVLGPNTREALRGYQQKENLNADGRLTRETADRLGIRKSSDSTVDDHFEAAGETIKEHYGEAGKSAGEGSKELGKEVKKGEVTEGAKDFGKGVGGFGKEIGQGTARGAKKIAEGVKDAFDGNSTKSKPSHFHSKESVVKAQQALKERGYYNERIDGVMGPRTQAALRQFQEKEGLGPTGRLTEETRKKLGID